MTNDYGKGRGAKNRIAKAARSAAWTQALREGRVLRINEETLTSYPTIARRDLAMADATAGGNMVEVVEENEAGQVRYGFVEADGAITWRVVREAK